MHAATYREDRMKVIILSSNLYDVRLPSTASLVAEFIQLSKWVGFYMPCHGNMT